MFLPVDQSGREISFLELLDGIKTEQAKSLKAPKSGKHSGARMVMPTSWAETDPAASLVAAAGRKRSEPLSIDMQDLRTKKMHARPKASVLFVLDASRSQGVDRRLAFAKGAILAMLSKSYAERDRVGLLTFADKRADLVLPFTRSVELGAEKVEALSAKGNTPLAMGIRKALKAVETEKRQQPKNIPILVIITDGKMNYDEDPGSPMALMKAAAREIKNSKVAALVVDTERGAFALGLAKELAREANAVYTTLR